MQKKLFILMVSLLSVCGSIYAQKENSVPFNGKVCDFIGNPLKRARIYIDKNYVSVSDSKGRFGLTDVKDTDTLKILYKKKIYYIPVEGRKSLIIRLDHIDNTAKYEAEEDQELVSVGFGYVKRRESLDVSNGISGDVLRRTNATNVLDALRGLVPGLNITTVNGQTKAYIRGIGSNSNQTDPLFLVDGMEVPSLTNISVYNVESVEVLKDGSMYGARGANGVIMVRTIGNKANNF
ncbi:MAG: TonB-dependent receptor plug domain-containing protein [Bacteroidales bacterium]|nr:TonB-dependent receptor plug domain-containing protein [Bacteroidales bacterium]